MPRFSNHSLRTVALSFVIPSDARDLRFRGPLLETQNTMLKQNSHLVCSGPQDKGWVLAHSSEMRIEWATKSIGAF